MDGVGSCLAEPSIPTRCAFCLAHSRPLNALRCLHVICRPCAEEQRRHDNTISCKKCRRVTPDPAPGHHLLLSLPSWPGPPTPGSRSGSVGAESVDQDDPLLLAGGEAAQANALDGGSEPQEVTVTVCQHSECIQFKVEAMGRCMDCDGGPALCEAHYSTHFKLRANSDHRGVRLGSTSSSVGSQQDVEHCAVHRTEALDQFCQQCQILICGKCVAQHRSHSMQDIASAAAELRQYFSENAQGASDTDVVQAQMSNIQSRLAAVMQQTEEVSHSIAHAFNKHRQASKRREEDLCAHVAWLSKKLATPLRRRYDEVVDRARRVDVARYLLQHASDCILLRSLHKEDFGRFDEGTGNGGTGALPATPPPDLGLAFEPFSDREYASVKELGVLRHHPQAFFDRVRKGSSLVISDDAMEVRAVSNDSLFQSLGRMWSIDNENWQSALSADVYEFGRTTVAVRVTGCGRGVFLGVARPDTPIAMADHRNPWPHVQGFCGWASGPHQLRFVQGGELGLPWRDGDVIRLSVMIEISRSHLSAVHERSGNVVSIPLPNGPFRFRAELAGSAAISVVSVSSG